MKIRNGFVSNSSSSSFVLSYNPEIGDLQKVLNRDIFEYGTDCCEFVYEDIFENQVNDEAESPDDPAYTKYMDRYNADKAAFMKMVEEEQREGRTKIISGTIDYHEDGAIRMMEFLSKSSDKFKVLYKEEC